MKNHLVAVFAVACLTIFLAVQVGVAVKTGPARIVHALERVK